MSEPETHTREWWGQRLPLIRAYISDAKITYDGEPYTKDFIDLYVDISKYKWEQPDGNGRAITI